MDIGAWLSALGLERYEAAFRAHDVDGDLLPRLTADDLREIGVASVGHRRKMLDAIASLTPPASAAPAHGPGPASAAQADTGDAGAAAPSDGSGPERRQLTVLFADLTESTLLSARLDPEEMGALLRRYQDTVSAAVAEYGGHVAKFMGDGVLAYFGWPHADEDAAERAVHAGLATVRAVSALDVAGQHLDCRIGIATGLVVVGELIGERAAREEMVAGETPNMAARLQDLARPGQVLVAPFTRQLLGETFDLRQLRPQTLKGFAAPVTAWQVRGEAQSISRFHAKRGRSPLPLIGREAERTTLMQAWAEAGAGRGSTWLLSGPAGIGKSRLVQAVISDALGGQDWPIQLQCSPFQGDTALHPVIRYVTITAEIDAAAPSATQIDQIRKALKRYGHAPDMAPLLAWLLGIETPDMPALATSASDAKRVAMKALVQLIHGIAVQTPLLLIVEDVHWADPTTLDLIGRVARTLADHRVLMILTSRPELPAILAPDAMAQDGRRPFSDLRRLDLGRLDNAATLEIAARIAGDTVLPDALLAEIARRTDGVPLFVEELTKSMLEVRARPPDTGDDDTGPAQGDAVSIPATLHDSLMTRLDRLGPVKTVAQTAAVIGRSFKRNLLQLLLKADDDALDAALERLQEAELIYVVKAAAQREVTFEFKHALVRDAAYESLLKRTRRSLHARLYHLLADDPEAAPALVARHAEGGDLRKQAMQAWEKAGALALARPAYAEAAAAYAAAIRLCKGLGKGLDRGMDSGLEDESDLLRQELRLTNRLGLAQMGALGYQAAPVGDIFQTALDLAERIGDPDLVFPAVFGLCTHRYTAGQRFATFGRLVDRAHEVLGALDDKSRRLNAPRLLALQTVRDFHAADYAQVIARVDQVYAVYDNEQVRTLVHRYGEDSRITATGYLAWALSFMGRVDAARGAVDTAVGWARELDHGASLAMALLNGAARNAIWLRDIQGCMIAAGEALQLARRQSLPLWEHYAQLHLGLTLAHSGKSAEVAMLASGLERFLNSGVRVLATPNLTLLAEAQIRLGEVAAARRTLDAARSAITTAQDLPFEPDLACAEARLALVDGADTDQACTLLRHALDVAQGQGAHLPALRAATALAQLMAERGKVEAARDLLTAQVGGLAVPRQPLADLTAARILLDTLA